MQWKMQHSLQLSLEKNIYPDPLIKYPLNENVSLKSSSLIERIFLLMDLDKYFFLNDSCKDAAFFHCIGDI